MHPLDELVQRDVYRTGQAALAVLLDTAHVENTSAPPERITASTV